MMARVEHGGNQMAVVLNPKTFSTGSVGYQGVDKITLDGKRYQVNFMLVEIGSKPK